MGIIVAIEILIIVGILVAVVAFAFGRDSKSDKAHNQSSGTSETQADANKTDENLTPEELEAKKEQDEILEQEKERQKVIDDAEKLKLGYDYDGAIELIKTYTGKEGDYSVYKILTDAIAKIEEEKKSLVYLGGSYTSVAEINHIFFHSLIADNSLAFDGDYDAKGYNMYMTTTYEFKQMMQSMYEDGYVLVSIHDLIKEVTAEDGTVKFVANDELMLPAGKKPFVLSQDDVNYYDYMDGDGFASRIVIGEDGKPTCEMLLADGTKAYGDFDMVPIIETFVAEHPDFSYQGARGIIALTGYEGALGYRTDDPTSPTYEEDVKTATAVADCMKENGWEFACHGWGHKNAQTITTEHFKTDTKRWLDEVAPIIGGSDIYIFPYGVDFETTMGHYSSEKYLYAKSVGFDYFCGVYSKPWMHIKDDYIRMTRRPLDGQAMLQFPERLEDLFDLEKIIDPERPKRDW